MSIIDWSDPDEMLGLLAEYIRDELTETSDRERRPFLRALAAAIESLGSQELANVDDTLIRLRSISDSQPIEFSSDPALIHLGDCILELERIHAQQSRD
jgi:hypothetical protein